MDRFRNRDSQPPKGEPARPTGSTDPSRQRWTTVGWIVASLLLFYLLQGGFQPGPEEVSLSRLLRLVEDGRVEEATVSETGVEGSLTGEDGEDAETFVTTLPPNYDT